MPYDKVQAIQEFSRWSRNYDRSILQRLLFGPSHRALIGRLHAVVGERPARILDVGCGTGVFAVETREALPNAKIWGIDMVSEMLTKGTERWRRHTGYVQPAQTDSERLPFPAGAFDVVTCSNSFHPYPRQDRAVAEMHRVLKPADGCSWSMAAATDSGAGSSTISVLASRLASIAAIAGDSSNTAATVFGAPISWAEMSVDLVLLRGISLPVGWDVGDRTFPGLPNSSHARLRFDRSPRRVTAVSGHYPGSHSCVRNAGKTQCSSHA